MEANLTGSPIDASYNDDAALAEVVNANEYITKVATARNKMEIYLEG